MGLSEMRLRMGIPRTRRGSALVSSVGGRYLRRAAVTTAELDAAAELIEATISAYESLKHPKHAKPLKPIREAVSAIMARYFRTQKRALLKEVDAHLKHLADGNLNPREASDDSRTAISSVIPDGMLLPISISAGMSADYAKAIESALTSGYDNLAAEFGATADVAADVVGEYLRDHSLSKLTGNLNSTTVERLRNALADAYEAGGDFEELKQAISDEYADFAGQRSEMIAQTEMNAAYNTGRKQVGLDLGFNEKSWNPDGMACPECVGAVLEGWIPIEDEFEAGADAPPLHPNCDCSLDVRLSNDE